MLQELQLLQQEINKEENANLSRSGEGGYKSCHLLLSEDEISPHCFAASNDNVSSLCVHERMKRSCQKRNLFSKYLILDNTVCSL